MGLPTSSKRELWNEEFYVSQKEGWYGGARGGGGGRTKEEKEEQKEAENTSRKPQGR